MTATNKDAEALRSIRENALEAEGWAGESPAPEWRPVWDSIVKACKDGFTSRINVGSSLRRDAIIAVDNELRRDEP